MKTFLRAAAAGALMLAALAAAAEEGEATAVTSVEESVSAAPEALRVLPEPRPTHVPRARWEYRRDGLLWTRVALSAIRTHGQPLLDVVPRDIAEWCPAYPGNSREDRAAFWAGMMSSLTRYESTFNPSAVGGNGRWFGLLQIYPPTAEFRKCRVQTGEGLKRASANLNCAVRIMAITVPRDEAISIKENRWKGVAADWGPIRNDWMRNDMQRYTRRQTYCRPLAEKRPQPRPI